MAIPSSINSLKPAELQKISERVEVVIKSAAERIHYAETRISGMTVRSTVLLGAGAAMITAAPHVKYDWMAVTIGGSGAYFIIFGLTLLVMISRQVNRYPWVPATKTWKWFYRDALQQHKEFKFPWWYYFGSFKKTKEAMQDVFERQLEIFCDKVSNNLHDDKENLWQDIQQLYVLHVVEKYKNIFLVHLRNVFTLFVLIAPIAVGLSAVGGYEYHQHRSTMTPAKVRLKNDGIKATIIQRN